MEKIQNLEMDKSPSSTKNIKHQITPKLVLKNSNEKNHDSSSDLSVTSSTEMQINENQIPPSPGTDSTDDILDFDDLLHHFGDCGRYQMLLFFLMIPFIFFLAFIFYTQMLITLVPMHWCKVPELESLSVHER